MLGITVWRPLISFPKSPVSCFSVPGSVVNLWETSMSVQPESIRKFLGQGPAPGFNVSGATWRINYQRSLIPSSLRNWNVSLINRKLIYLQRKEIGN